MKKLITIIIIMTFGLIISCSDSNDPSNKATLNIKSELTQGTVQLTDLVNKEISILKTSRFSRINKVRILLSRIKLHLKTIVMKMMIKHSIQVPLFLLGIQQVLFRFGKWTN